jgi:predicted nicotinamide N-methyase
MEGTLDVKGKRVLEIGSGTGLAGIACEKMGAKEVVLTDFHENTLKNLTNNVHVNGCSSDIVVIEFLDWRTPTESNIKGLFDVIIAADIVYDPYHAEVVPTVMENFLDPTGEAILVLESASKRTGMVEFEKNLLNYFTYSRTKILHPEAYNHNLYTCKLIAENK